MRHTTTKNSNGGEAAGGPQFLKARAVAARVGLCPKTIHRWAEAGHITRRKLGARLVLFDLNEVLRYIAGGAV